MSRKHFIALAAALRDAKPADNYPAAVEAWRAAVKAVAQACKADNPRFKADHFMNAAGAA